MNKVISIENISKQYRLGTIGTGTISHDLNRWWYKIRGKEDPYQKIGDENNRSAKADSNYVWALRDISFDVEKGNVIGIIGRNGAGKSTLLKILSQITKPTKGEIKVCGRIASLLEVGTGFHPEMTGRENIYLNGAIMGMTKAEISRKLDEIIDFAGIQKYVDTPVKRYSSGMIVRLGFAVAAHLDPEILVIDEVLAVGDIEFQKKAIGKMQEVTKGEGRTVLFVSHNMAAVKSLCTKGIILENGQVSFIGDCEKAVDLYTISNKQLIDINNYRPVGDLPVDLHKIRILNKNGDEKDKILSGDHVLFELTYQNNTNNNIIPAIGFYDFLDQPLFLCGGRVQSVAFESKGINKIYLEIAKFPLPEGEYYLNIELAWKEDRRYIPKACKIYVENGDFYGTGILSSWKKGVLVEYNWSKK